MAIFGAILAAACLFFFYALVKFHREAVRPRPQTRGKNRVIVFRKTHTKSEVHRSAKPMDGSGDPGEAQGMAQPLPFGVRRLAVRSASRR
jgi:hypothetical protein